MIYSAARDFIGPASELAEIIRDGRSARSAALGQMNALLGRLLASANDDNPEPLRRLLKSYARRASSWSPTNWILLHTQRPNLTEPVTIREMRALGHQPKEGVVPAALLIPVAVPDQLPIQRHNPGNVVRMPDRGAHAPQRLFFRFTPCVYDLHTDTEGPAVSPPARTEASRAAFVARVEKLASKLGCRPAQLDSLSRAERATLTVETIFGHYQAQARGADGYAALRLATFLTLEAEGIESQGPDQPGWTPPSHWKVPKQILGEMNSAAALVRRLTEGVRQLAVQEAREQKTSIDPQVLSISDLAMQAESGRTAELATLRGLWETTGEPPETEEWESPDESLPPPPLPSRRDSLQY